ncbi:MAG TPA: FHIPEP family type III secretion protein [bacterium]|nr:FHIPEP family type III secretion protein [bacterium]
MLLQSILSLSVVLVYFIYWVMNKNITVACQFTKDSLPGKQMAVDADLMSGIIDQNKADKLRQKLSDSIIFVDKSKNFIKSFFPVYTISIFIILLLNLSFIIFTPILVKIFVITLILLNCLIIIFWIFLWYSIEKKCISPVIVKGNGWKINRRN